MLAPKLRFKEFATEWQQARLSELVLKITDGTHDTPIVQKQGIPFLTAINVKDGYIDYDNIGYVDEVTHKKIFERCNPEKDDLLIVNIGAGTATCARNIVDYPFSLKNVALIKPNINLLNPKFLEQIQRKNAKKLFSTLTSGGAQPFLSLKEIGKFVINYSSVEEQTKITSFLSAVDEKISQLKQKHALLNQYKQGMMQKLFSQQIRFKADDGSEFGEWEEKKIGDIFKVTSGATPLRSDERFFKDADIDWVKTTDLNNGKILKTEEKISQFALKETSVKILPKGTVFVAMYGGFNQIGRTGLLVKEAACNQALSAIYPNEKINSYFLLTYFNYKVLDWKNFAASSRKDPNITKSDVLAFPFIYPTDLEEQTKIANFLSVIDQKIEVVAQQIEQAKTWKKGLLQQVFV